MGPCASITDEQITADAGRKLKVNMKHSESLQPRQRTAPSHRNHEARLVASVSWLLGALNTTDIPLFAGYPGPAFLEKTMQTTISLFQPVLVNRRRVQEMLE